MTDPPDRRRALAALRDPMSKTLVVSLVGIVCLTVVAMAVVVGATRAGTLSDGAMVGLIGTIVGGISTCVTAVSSRAQGPTSATATAKADPDVG